MDTRRFRANIFVDLAPAPGFAENDFVGQTIRIGRRVVISILERDSRCAMITIDPDTADRNPTILSHVVKTRNGEAGVYGAELVEGVVRVGDPIESSDCVYRRVLFALFKAAESSTIAIFGDYLHALPIT